MSSGLRRVLPAGMAVTIVLAFLTAAASAVLPIRSDDVFMYLELGRRLTHGGLPAVDPFLFSRPDYHWHVRGTAVGSSSTTTPARRC